MISGFIYFIRAQGNGPIKIGFTRHNPRQRMVKIQSDCPWPVDLIGAIHGTVSQEKQIHAVLASFRTQGEWFSSTPTVLAAVDFALEIGRKAKFPTKKREPRHPHPLCRYRSENGLTLVDMSAVLGVTYNHLCEIERGKNKPSLDLAARMSRATGIDILEFVPCQAAIQ